MNIETPLDYFVYEPLSGPETDTGTLFVFHGYAQHKFFLPTGFREFFPHFYVVSVQAPFPLGNYRYAWFHIKNKGEEYIDRYEPDIPANAEPVEDDIDISLGLVKDLVEKWKAAHRGSTIYMLGFSQGASLCYELLSAFPSLASEYIPASGYLIRNKQAVEKKSFKGIRVLVLHGLKDKLIPVRVIDEIDDFLRKGNADYRLVLHPSGHVLETEQLARIAQWIGEKA